MTVEYTVDQGGTVTAVQLQCPRCGSATTAALRRPAMVFAMRPQGAPSVLESK